MRDGEHLARALKIIMHSNYLHTRDNPQRVHAQMDVDLDAVDDDASVIIGPIDENRYIYDDFSIGDLVEVWHQRGWWHGKVIYRSNRHKTLTVRITGSQEQLSGILPRNAKPAL